MMAGWGNAWSVGWRTQDRRGTWREVVRENCRARGLDAEDAVGHGEWRMLMGDVR